MRVLLTSLIALLAAAPAQAAVFTPFGVGSEIEALVPTTDGGAWVVSGLQASEQTIGRLDPVGRFSAVNRLGFEVRATLGPDGQAWFVDAANAVYRGTDKLAMLPGAEPGPIATGPDGTLWAPTANLRTLARVGADGHVMSSPLAPPRCADGHPYASALARAADGAMWFADLGCSRALRLGPDGVWTSAPLSYESTSWIAPDLAGGAWVHGDGGADYLAGGERFEYNFDGGGQGLAVAPDGAAWVAQGGCGLTRVAPDGSKTTGIPAPIPARRVAFAPDGQVWLASRARVAHGLEGADACDETPPRLTLPERVSRRTRTVTLTVSKPALVHVLVHNGNSRDVAVQERLRFRVPAAALRTKRVRISVVADDVDGNRGRISRSLRVRR